MVISGTREFTGFRDDFLKMRWIVMIGNCHANGVIRGGWLRVLEL